MESKNDSSSSFGIDRLLSGVDESPDFYDPYSDLNLFLSKKIKQEMQQCNSSKKWSVKIQEELLEKISPEFQSKFPQYRLGISALKRTWEKLSYYTQQFKGEKEALTEEGKLNTEFFIKENLKCYASQKHSLHFHPSHFAHQLASKMSECIATINAERPKLDQLTQLIWSVQRHLLIGGTFKSPYDQYDKIDKLIVRTILEITTKNPQINHSQLEEKVKEALHALHELPSLSSMDKISANVSALLAEKLYANSPFHSLFFAEQKNALHNFIARHSSLCKTSAPLPQLSELVRRITALYTLATGLTKTLQEEQFKAAVLASYPSARTERPPLPQNIYAFISAEIVLMRSEEFCRSSSFVADAIWQAYQEAVLLPVLPPENAELLEIVIWKSLSETENLLEKLPYRIGLKIEEEIANTLIDNPRQTFSSLVQTVIQFFKRTKELVETKKCSDLNRKIHTWAIQGDMLCRWIKVSAESPLLNLILKKFYAGDRITSHTNFVSEICQCYLQCHPELTSYLPQLNQRIWILYKYAWYTHFSTEKESSYDRFLKWHALQMPLQSSEHTIARLEEIARKTVPLLPFDKKHVEQLLSLTEQVDA